MKIGTCNLDKQMMIIAEIGNNHEGSFALAEELIGRAAEAGADAVKFQTIVPERLVSSDQTARIAQLKRFQFSYQQFERLKATADRHGIIFLSTPFDLESTAFLDSLVPAFKIASGDNTFYPLLEAVAATGKPLLLSCGLSDLAGIRKARNRISAVWSRMGISGDRLALLHCNVSYPTPPQDANLLAIHDLKRLVPTVGYSDHTLGIEAAVLSVACGARIIEKHFTLDHAQSDFRDHQLSADPQELRELVRRVREAELLLGSSGKKASESEQPNMASVRRSLAAARDLEAGARITAADLTWLRPGTGLPPGSERRILGKITGHPIAAGHLICPADLKQGAR